MSDHGGSILLTGATGFLGRGVLDRLLGANPSLRAFVLVRNPARWPSVAARLRHATTERVTPVPGDLWAAGLGLTARDRARVTSETTAIIHLAADTVFSRPLTQARRINTDGTVRVMELADDCRALEQFTFVSTAFVAGRLTGLVLERDNGTAAGWVNAYEQSKYEAEALLRESRIPWLILRPSTVVCDSTDGTLTQVNAVHRALRLYRRGLAAMMPGTDQSLVDVVPSDYVNGAIARLALRPHLAGRTMQLCAGDKALPLGELLDITYDVWAADPEWRRRAIPRPALADAGTYRLFEQSVEETANNTLRQVIRSLSHFVPQLALEKRFATLGADTELGFEAPPVRDYWRRVVEHLGAAKRGAALQGRAA